MSSTPARIADTDDTRALSATAVPVPELPGSVEELAASAAVRLGWHGVVLPEMVLMGRKVIVVAELLADAHAERLCLGAAPETDRATVSTWVWPEMDGRVPPSAVRIVGVLAVARHWRTALASAVPFARFGNAAAVLPTSVVFTHDYLANCLPRVRRYGVSVLLADEELQLSTDVAGRNETVPVEDTATTRWVNELVYERVLATAS
ncbi:hypothetical protein ACQPYE_00155 [Actinosynnema sp. CA-299493]|uniref:Uncharacterized protein n=1 Tax=Saccharothrix texasensis TaxID=103734 RepID=A0A3N1H9V1_9PSEU|nr:MULTISPECIES: hypothetical protein [Saccharothrix]QQQ76491.1 hypothetical protein IOD16_36755 [Saccharothrix sp. 6-C]ROP39293.1 hypothetical protein EDD40_4675 [Saccharothrix texasensis]